jgi:hypothetical protein
MLSSAFAAADAVDDGVASMDDTTAARGDDATLAARASEGAALLKDASDADADDPLTSSAAALAASVPRALNMAAAQDASIEPLRVWTTLCCTASLERLNVCVLFGDASLFPEVERTVVDAAREWTAREAAAKPALARALADGRVVAAAEAATEVWRRATEARVAALRRADAIVATRPAAHAHRGATQLARALCTRQATCAIFLSEPLDGLQRWQMWCILVTVVASQLLVNSASRCERLRACVLPCHHR